MSGATGVEAVPSLKYRPEIDGLRAIAVVPVVLFHAGFHVFSGGYVGVDVFLVISGYLITGILLSDIDRQRFSIARFYERRARRILPALFCVLLACLPFAWFAMLPDELARFGRSMLAVIGFVSNVTFWLEEGYFSSASELKPLLHTWSLAVEEQFYIVFPLLLFVLRKASRRTLTVLIAIAALISFAVCEMAAYRYQLANFYLAPTRAWELLAGSLCACLGWQGHRRGAGLLALAGLAMILVSIFLLDGTVVFPSHWALLPVVGTMLLILFARAESGAGRLLAMTPLVGIGLISYSLYLWHQPIFAFARLFASGPLSQATMLGLALLAGVLAALSWRFVEQPFRRRDGVGAAKRALPLALGLSAVLAGLGAWLWLAKGVPSRFTPPRDSATISMTRADPPPRADGGDCQPDADGFAAPCTLMPLAGAQRRIALFGDSHAQAILPAFRELARQRQAQLHYAALGGCPALLGGFVIGGNYQPQVCADFAANALAHARRTGVDTVYLVGRWTLYTAEDPMNPPGRYLLADSTQPLLWSRADSRRMFGVLLARTIDAYRAAGITVVIVDQVPAQRFMVDRAVKWLAYKTPAEGLETAIARQSVSVADFQTLRAAAQPAVQAQQARGVAVLRFDDVFRRGGAFPWAAPDTSWYRDASHISTAGALRLVPALLAEYDSLSAPPAAKAAPR